MQHVIIIQREYLLVGWMTQILKILNLALKESFSPSR